MDAADIVSITVAYMYVVLQQIVVRTVVYIAHCSIKVQ